MRYVIVGNGWAAVAAAQALAEEDPSATIEIFGDEPYWAYRRPQLPDLLAGGVDLEHMWIHPPAWYEERGIAVHRDVRVEALDPPGQAILLSGGQRVPYDRLLLAMGSTAYVPPLAGTGRRGFFTLRTVDDALAIRDYAAKSRRAIVIGGGLLGLESARGLSSLGLQITIIEYGSWILQRQLDAEGAAILAPIMEGMGIRVVTHGISERVLGDECVAGLSLRGGTELEAELVLCATGVRPQTALAEQAGLTVNRGVVVDEHLRTSTAGIFATGDVAEYAGQVYGILPVAWEQSRVAAANMAGREATYAGTVPSTTLKVAGVDLTSIGEVNPRGEGFIELRRSEPEAGRYLKAVLHEGRLVGAILLGDRRRVGLFRRLITQGSDVSAFADRLLEDDFQLP